MQHITTDDIKEVARLSGFSLTDEELETYRGQFEELVAYFEQLGTVETHGVEPTYQVTGLENVTREDEATDYGVSKEELLKNAPDHDNEQIKVRRVL